MADQDGYFNDSIFSTNSTFTSTIINDLTSIAINVSNPLYELTTENMTTDSMESTTRTSPRMSTESTEKVTNNVSNITKVVITNFNSTQLPMVDLTTKTTICSTTEEPFDEFGPPEGVQYIFVPLGVMVFVVILSAVVLIISRKRKLERLRHRLMPLYNFDPGEEGEDDWETELLDENFDSRQKRQGYQSMDTEENAELFSNR